MDTTGKTIIRLHKGKLVKLVVISALFVAAGTWMLITPPEHSLFKSRVVTRIIGIAAILFFAVGLLLLLKKIAGNRPGLIVDDNGITDYSSEVAAGFIPWSDIREIRAVKVLNQRFLVLMVSNPGAYLNRQTNVFRRKAMEMNFNKYGSPLSIAAGTLQCRFEDLETLLTNKLAAAKQNNG